MALKKADFKQAVFAELFYDGTLMVRHEKVDTDAGTVSWYSLHQTQVRVWHYGSKPEGFHGRVFFSNKAFHMLLDSNLSGIGIYTDNASQSMCELGITADTLIFEYKDYQVQMHILRKGSHTLMLPDVRFDVVRDSYIPDYDAVQESGYHDTIRIKNAACYK